MSDIDQRVKRLQEQIDQWNSKRGYRLVRQNFSTPRWDIELDGEFIAGFNDEQDAKAYLFTKRCKAKLG